MNPSHAAPASGTPAVDIVPIRRVLVSVFDKTGLARLAAGLKAAGVRVVSTGGTSAALASHGLEVEDVSAITSFPEILDGRVKTLHPRIFAGVLARHDRADDKAVLAAHGIAVRVRLPQVETEHACSRQSDDFVIETVSEGTPTRAQSRRI